MGHVLTPKIYCVITNELFTIYMIFRLRNGSVIYPGDITVPIFGENIMHDGLDRLFCLAKQVTVSFLKTPHILSGATSALLQVELGN